MFLLYFLSSFCRCIYNFEKKTRKRLERLLAYICAWVVLSHRLLVLSVAVFHCLRSTKNVPSMRPTLNEY